MKWRDCARAGLAAVVIGGSAAALPNAASAQSDILFRLRSGSPLGDRFRVDSASGVVALGQIGIGIIPASGAGTRMMWYPYKASFRAGHAEGTQFDDANMGIYSWAGGLSSTAAGLYAFAMGYLNTVESGAQAGVALGRGNRVWGAVPDVGSYGVALGVDNNVRDHAGVAIGHGNWSDGDAAVAMGYRNTADGDYSMAFGYRASTNGHTGAKVFADASIADSIEAVANNEFAVRAAGGYRFRSNATLTNGCNIAAGGAAISCASSWTVKEGFSSLDAEDVLHKVAGLTIDKWRYTDEAQGVYHIGPIAEDFYDAFGLGDDRKAIGHIDQMGVTMLATQALEKRTRSLKAENAALRTELGATRDELAATRNDLAEWKQRLVEIEKLLKTRQ